MKKPALKADFAKMVDQAMKIKGREGLRPVVEKELLHYDILFALNQEGFLKDLTFQGGTSLRLCYGSDRFSEDLGFAGGPTFSSIKLQKIADTLEKYLGGRYGLEVDVKEPKELRDLPQNDGITVDKWQVSVTTAPGNSRLPRQRIKFEVANIPAYTSTRLTLARNYSFLPNGYEDTLLKVETPDEIMADKLVAFPACTSHIRHRDIWDLRFLMRMDERIRPKVNADLVQKKLADYGIQNFDELLDGAIARIPEIIRSKAFAHEMDRFVPADARAETFGKGEGWFEPLSQRTVKIFSDLRNELYPKAAPADLEFF